MAARRALLSVISFCEDARSHLTCLEYLCSSTTRLASSKSVVDLYDTHVQAGKAINAHQKESIDMKNPSIAGRSMLTDEHVIGYRDASTLFSL